MRAAELDTLFTANVDQIAQAEDYVKQVGHRVESKPIVKKFDGDAKGALASMDRVEQRAKQLVSKDQVVRLDADIRKGEAAVTRINDRLESLKIKALGGLDVTADVKRAEASLSRVTRNLAALKTARTMIDVAADPSDALDAVSRVDTAVKQLVSRDTAIRINASVREAEASVASLEAELDYLRALSPNVEVEADVRRAEAKLDGARRALRDLDGARATMQVEVDEGRAGTKLQNVADMAEEAGEDGGRRGGEALGDGIVGALATLPIAGAVVGIGAVAAKALIEAFQDGLAQEANRDELQALTGISESAALRLGRVAGEAYANNFGESIESNMDATRLLLQFNLIDEDETYRSAQRTIEGLVGIADVLREEVGPASTTVSTLLRTGLAKSVEQAYDLLAVGAREGLNRNEDLLDTLTEYPVVLRRLGLSGEEALGLINQGLDAGARNTDVVADALKELQLQMMDTSETATSRNGIKLLGLDAEDMYRRFAEGGPAAREGLEMILTGMRELEDPVTRNQVALDLFKTKAEDLGESLFALDLTTAVDQLNGVEGAAKRMFDTLADNDATKLEGAKRNIDVALAGIQGALAVALSDPIEDFSTWVSSNRGPMIGFFLDLANGALDFGEALVEAAASGTEAFGDFVSGPAEQIVETIKNARRIIAPFADTSDLDQLQEDMRGFKDVTSEAADEMRDRLGGAIDEARTGLNDFGDDARAMADLSDRQQDLANAVGQIGDEAGHVRAQVLAAYLALEAERDAALDAGEGLEEVNSRYRDGEKAILDQAAAAAGNREEAQKLIDTVKGGARGRISFVDNTGEVQRRINQIISQNSGRTITLNVRTNESQVRFTGSDHIATSRAEGGPIHGPGSGTSDSIPAWLSNGEHVLTADEVLRAGGHGAIYRLRAAIKSGALQKSLSFARGGSPQWNLTEAERDWFRQQRVDWSRAQRRGENRADGMNGNGFALVDKLLEAAAQSHGRVAERMRAEALRSEKRYLKLESSADRAGDRLEKLRDRLGDLRDTAASMAASVTGAVRRFFDAGKLADTTKLQPSTRTVDGIEVTTVGTVSTPVTAGGIATSMKSTAVRIKGFAVKLRQLGDKGIAPKLLAEIASLGVEDGEPVADALLTASKAELKSINSSYATIGRYSNSAGQIVADENYEKLIEKAEKQVREAKRNADDIRRQLTKETDRIVRVLTEALSDGSSSNVVKKKKALGGPVIGPGTGTSDSIDARLSNGEHIWTAAEVNAAGGHERVERIRQAALAGRLEAVTSAPSSKAIVAASTQITVAPQFHNPIVKDLEQEAWEASQIVAGSVGGGHV